MVFTGGGMVSDGTGASHSEQVTVAGVREKGAETLHGVHSAEVLMARELCSQVRGLSPFVCNND